LYNIVDIQIDEQKINEDAKNIAVQNKK